jgi:hypothetical protein
MTLQKTFRRGDGVERLDADVDLGQRRLPGGVDPARLSGLAGCEERLDHETMGVMGVPIDLHDATRQGARTASPVSRPGPATPR